MGKNLSTFAIAEMLQVDPGSVANWIDQDILKAHRTPGGHRRVAINDLLDFLRRHKMPIPKELQTAPMRVLVVDDEPALAQMVGRAIRQACPNVEVYEANDGFNAGTMVTTLKPQMVILDLRMPGMDGYEICKVIKAQPAMEQTQILAMTAYPSPDSEQRIIACGARRCLSKPLDLDVLIQEVQSLF